MTAGVIAFVVSFFVPFAWYLLVDVLFERNINVRAIEHTDERIEQQHLDAVVVQLPTNLADNDLVKKAA